MKLTKKEKILVAVVSIFLLFLINVLSNYIILSTLGVTIYNENYNFQQKKFIKNLGNKVHPFYGLAAGSEMGFKSDISDENNFTYVSPKPNSPDREIKILILGGSVASDLSNDEIADMPDHLFAKKLNKYYNTDRFVIYNAAFGGGKQPQQYFKLMYLELLGFMPDIILNYDGFNEIALPLGENFNRKLNAIFPRSFDRLVLSSTYDGDCFELNNYLLSFNSFVPIIELLKWFYVRSCHKASVGIGLVSGFGNTELSIPKDKFLKQAVSVWELSSNLINSFALRNSIPYMHFIQPNQYLENSKQLTRKEKKEFFNYEPYKIPIRDNYEKLKIEKLDATYKFDQRYLFVEETRTVYSDNCCHFNFIGMNRIIEDIIEKGDTVFRLALANN